MYAAIPGKTNMLAARIEIVVAPVAKPVQRPVVLASMPVQKLVRGNLQASSKAGHAEFSRKDCIGNFRNYGKEQRDRKHSNLGRRGRRAVIIFH